MNHEQQIPWRRYTALDPMNAHSQADDPTLMYVMQFNSDENECQQRRRSKKRFVLKMIDGVPGQQDG